MLRIINFICPMIENYKDNCKLKEQLGSFKQPSLENYSVLKSITDINSISKDSLLKKNKEELERKNKLEDKAKTNIVGITIAVTLILGASDLLDVITNKYTYSAINWLSFLLFGLAILYMVSAGILSMRVIINENEFFQPAFISEISTCKEYIEEIDLAICRNRVKNLIRNNSVFTAYECIRNSLICLLVVWIISSVPISNMQNVDNTIITTTNSGYSFFYSLDAINNMDNIQNLSLVEEYILSHLCADNNYENDSGMAVIDTSQKLFIKYNCHDKRIDILLLEPYIEPVV